MAGRKAELDFAKAKQVAQSVMNDVGSVMHGMLSYIGDRVGLFKAMMDAGPLTVDQVAAKTGLSARYVREWLGAMAAAGYVEYDAGAQTYLLTPEYAAALADEESPFFIGSYFQMAQAAAAVAPEVAQAFRTGKGVTQAQYPAGFFEAAERNSNTRYKHKLLRKWIPAMPQVVEVTAGGRHRGGRRMWRRPRRDHDRAGIPEGARHRLRRACRVNRSRAPQCRSGGSIRPRELRGRQRHANCPSGPSISSPPSTSYMTQSTRLA